ncbi:MAG: hypothetical protein VX331_06350 [Candidatus Thermoplasmatota archaeon]|nr:hypothetical protein [Candidatus Thermoplasmatota archaeon]
MTVLLIVDLLPEREAFGKKGVEEIVKHFPDYEILLWAPHIENPIDYGFGTRIDEPNEYDVVVITGSRRNVSMWEPWMDRVAKLIKECKVPLYGICFGHQIICKVLGGEVIRAEEKTESMMFVNYNDTRVVNQLFSHQDHVIDSGEMEVIASSEHCDIVACVHPTREIKTVQFHPEAVLSVLDYSVECGDMNEEERVEFGDGIQDLDFSMSFFGDI